MSWLSGFICVTLCFAFSSTQVPANGKDLVALVQIFRHGQRNPTSWYTNDPWKDPKYYTLGSGQLTKVGKQMHYKLGRFTRRRYGSFIPRTYNPEWFKAQTTDVDRTHMSCQANLAAIFFPTKDEMWNPLIPWQPIPVHPIDSDVLSGFPSCSIYFTDMKNTLTNEPFFKALNVEYADLYTYLSNHSGQTVSSLISVYSLYDTLHIEDQFGFALPTWTQSVYPEPMRNLSGYAFTAYTYTTRMKRLAAGSWLNTVYTYFENIFNDTTSYQKFQMWSAHDMNIAAILNTLGAFKPHYPAFASTIYFELRNKSGTPTINIWHKDDELRVFEPITVAGCSFDCSLSDFKTAMSDFLLDTDTYAIECAATSTSFSNIDDVIVNDEDVQVVRDIKELVKSTTK